MRRFVIVVLLCMTAWGLDVGLNLSAPDTYMSIYHAELIPQGLFHPREWRSVVHVRSAADNRVVADFWDTTWNTSNIGWKPGTWDGGRWENPLTGETGSILRFVHESNRPVFYLDRAPSSAAGKPLFVFRTEPGRTTWTKREYPHLPLFNEVYNAYQVQTNKDAPKAIDWRGEYTFVADVSDTATLEIRMPGWTHRFTGSTVQKFRVDTDTPGIGGVTLYMISGDSVEIRGMSLKRAGVGGVAQAAYDALHTLRPTALRYWQTQMGQSLDGMMIGAFHAFSPRDATARRWELALPDFLDLCEALGATPWVVCPTVFRDDEVKALSELLPSGAYFEYGNESWGANAAGADPFAGASLAFDYPAVAQRKLAVVTRTDITTVLNGHMNLSWTRDFRKAAPAADRVAIAPYYNTTALTSRDFAPLGERPLVYEIQSHFHTRPHELNGTMVGAVAGIYHILDVASDMACVFTAFQYEYGKGVYLWGIWRDTATYQPRALAVALQGLRDFQPTERLDNLTWTNGRQTLYLSDAEGRTIPESQGELLTCETPNVADVPVGWVAWSGTEIPAWSMVLAAAPDALPAPTEMTVTVPAGVRRLVIDIE